MAQVIENKKGFRVIKVTLLDCFKFGGIGICDWCNERIGFCNGYYVAVLNSVMCEQCYNEWSESAIYYPEDCTAEERYFNNMRKILNL